MRVVERSLIVRELSKTVRARRSGRAPGRPRSAQILVAGDDMVGFDRDRQHLAIRRSVA